MSADKKFRVLVSLVLVLVLRCMFPLPSFANDTEDHHVRYKLFDIGGLGGPGSFLQNGFDGILNNHGALVGWADTAKPDPTPDFCANFDCLVSHAFLWHQGKVRDLGALRRGASSQAFWISRNGLIAGNSQNGKTDPLFPGFPEIRAVLWHDGKIVNLGTLEHGHETIAGAVNSRGEVVGGALNTVEDPFSLVGFGVQVRAFLWQQGQMRDLGTLGGPDALANFINERGQIAGISYTNSIPNSTTGIPTQDPFFWWHGKMHDVGSLGGTLGQPNAFNNHGQMVGISDLAGDQISHPFLWDKGVLTDLKTLGGDSGLPNWISEQGVIAGKADLLGETPQNHNAVLWKDGLIQDLGTLPGDACANAYFVNSRGQVVGTSESRELCLIPTGEHAFLWEHGGPMVDLNTLIPANSNLALTFAVAINDRGEIAGFGVPPGCAPADVEVCGHAYVLMPCTHDAEACRDDATPDEARPAAPMSATRRSPRRSSRNPLTSRKPQTGGGA